MRRTANTPILLAAAFTLLAALFTYYFLWQAGYYTVTVDGQRYLAAAQGLAVELPYNTRIAAPLLAAALARISGLSVQAALQAIGTASLIGALAFLAWLLLRRGAALGYVLALAVGWGSGLAIFYGAHPVLVDSLLLLATCAFNAALARDRLALALGCVCVAALTKEYGLLLAIPWAVAAWRTGGWRRAAWAFLPALLLAGVVAAWPAAPGIYGTYGVFIERQLLFQAIWLSPGVLRTSLRLWYLSAWGAAWPLLLFSMTALAIRLYRRAPLRQDERTYLAALPALPVLLAADWDRTFLLLIPFAAQAAAAQPFARGRVFQSAFALGGLCTALWRQIELSRYLGPTPLDPLRPALIALSGGAAAVLLCLWMLTALRMRHARKD
jgi:hypothetical protein